MDFAVPAIHGSLRLTGNAIIRWAKLDHGSLAFVEQRNKDVLAQLNFADFSFIQEEERIAAETNRLRRLTPFQSVDNACAIWSARIAQSAIRGCRRFDIIESSRGGEVERRAGPRHADIWSERRGCAQVQEFAPFSDCALRRCPRIHGRYHA